MKYTVYGVGARVQIQIYDLTTDDIEPKIRKDKISIYAYSLPSNANRNTALSIAGEQIYTGHSLAECLDIVKQKLKLKASFRGKLPPKNAALTLYYLNLLVNISN